MIDPFEGYEELDAPNWDSYNAEPIRPSTLKAARILLDVLRDLPTPAIAPGGDGTIGFEFRWPDGREMNIDVGPGQHIRVHVPGIGIEFIESARPLLREKE
jgi:hypothetical protein